MSAHLHYLKYDATLRWRCMLKIVSRTSFRPVTVEADHSPPRGLRHEMSSLARTLGSWVLIPLKAWMFAFILSLCSPV
jgi:hypothetical protein